MSMNKVKPVYMYSKRQYIYLEKKVKILHIEQREGEAGAGTSAEGPI